MKVLSAREGEDPADGSTGLIVSLERGLQVIELLADSTDGLSFPDLRRRLEVNQGICFKLLATLEKAGYVFRSEETGNYLLSYKVSNLGLKKLRRSGLLEQSTAVLRSLANATGEIAWLALAEGDQLTWVLSVAGEEQKARSLRIEPSRTIEVSLHTNATGKAWLSALPWERAKELLRGRGIAPATRNSLTTYEAIKAELERAKRAGFAIAYEENELGIGGVAAPIMVTQLDGALTCAGTVSIVAPTSLFSRANFREIGTVVAAAARDMATHWPVQHPSVRPFSHQRSAS